MGLCVYNTSFEVRLGIHCGQGSLISDLSYVHWES